MAPELRDAQTGELGIVRPLIRTAFGHTLNNVYIGDAGFLDELQEAAIIGSHLLDAVAIVGHAEAPTHL
jgi:hypothetical protein